MEVIAQFYTMASEKPLALMAAVFAAAWFAERWRNATLVAELRQLAMDQIRATSQWESTLGDLKDVLALALRR